MLWSTTEKSGGGESRGKKREKSKHTIKVTDLRRIRNERIGAREGSLRKREGEKREQVMVKCSQANFQWA